MLSYKAFYYTLKLLQKVTVYACCGPLRVKLITIANFLLLKIPIRFKFKWNGHHSGYLVYQTKTESDVRRRIL